VITKPGEPQVIFDAVDAALGVVPPTPEFDRDQLRLLTDKRARVLLESRPGIKVLFLSGYTDDAVVRHGILLSEVAFLNPVCMWFPVAAVLFEGQGRELPHNTLDGVSLLRALNHADTRTGTHTRSTANASGDDG